METINQNINQCQRLCSSQRQPGARRVWRSSQHAAPSDCTEGEGEEKRKIWSKIRSFRAMAASWFAAALSKRRRQREPHSKCHGAPFSSQGGPG